MPNATRPPVPNPPRVKTDGKRYEERDARLAGLYVCHHPSGKKSWVYRYRFKGAQRKLTIGDTCVFDRKRALKIARNAVSAIDEGRDPAAEKQASKRNANGPAINAVQTEKS